MGSAGYSLDCKCVCVGGEKSAYHTFFHISPIRALEASHKPLVYIMCCTLCGFNSLFNLENRRQKKMVNGKKQ